MSDPEEEPMTAEAMASIAAPSNASVPPDPAEYDSERSAAARRRGLATPYIPGGRDPDQAAAEREERRYLRLLLAMVIVIVASGFVVGLVAAALGWDFLVGTPS